MSRPNILYYIVHDLGKHLGCYGAPIESPNLDAFAAQSVRFESAFCNSAACTPSRCCAMTGLYAHTSGGVGLAHIGWPLPEGVLTIVDYLNDAGYETIHAGMQHERHPGRMRYQTELQKHWVNFNAHRSTDDALAYLAKRDRARPFYLNIGSQQPHASTWGKTDALYGGAVPPEDVFVPQHMPDTPELRQELGQFQAAIRYVDTHFGRLMAGLERLGYARDTIVIFTTDHGISGPRSKSTLYDRGTEITLLARMPDGRGAGSEVRHLIQNIDYVPTLLQAAGAPLPERLQGRSFWPLLTGGDYVPHQHIFTERNFHGEWHIWGKPDGFVDRYDPTRAVRTPEFHYIWRADPRVNCRDWLPWEIPHPTYKTKPGDFHGLPQPREPRPEAELYQVTKDPLEFIDLHDRPEFRHVRRDLEERLMAWMRDTDDFVLRGDVPKRYEAPNYGSFEGMPGDEEQARREGWLE